MKVDKGKKEAPVRWCVTGPGGIGKSTFAATLPGALFACIEDGTNELDVNRAQNDDGTPLASLADFRATVKWLTNNDHEFQTLVIDTADALNAWIERSILEDEGWKSIESPGYGKGYTRVLEEWRLLLASLERLQREKRMNVLLLAHTHIKRFNPPDSEPFDRYDLKVSDKASALIREWCDAVLFAQHEVVVHKAEKSDKKGRGFSTGNRIIQTVETASVVAKNRYGLPETMPFDAGTYTAIDDHRKMNGEQASAQLEKIIEANTDAKAKAAELRAWFATQTNKPGALSRLRERFAIKEAIS